MYSLYVVAGQFERSASGEAAAVRAIGESARRVIADLPDVASALRVDTLGLPEIGGGWATVSPQAAAAPALIQQHVDAELALLVFGQIDASRDAAQSVEREFRRAGLDALNSLSGVFSAVVVERRHSRLSVFTSVPGCRSLRYVCRGPALFLSTLDVGLVALSGMDVDVDLEAVAATVGCGWAIGGSSALRGVAQCSSLEQLVWSDGRLERRAATRLCAGRVDAADSAGLRRKVDEVIDELRSGVREQLQYTNPHLLSTALTAGVDSRAALSLMLSHRPASTIESYTRGDANTLDVRVARDISRRLGIQHRVIGHERGHQGPVADNIELVARATNGGDSVERALTGAFEVATTPPVLGGGGGEIFRGYYYNYVRRRGRRLNASGVADALLAFPLRRSRSCRFADPLLSSAPQRLVHAAVRALEVVSRDPYDLADLFYLVERFSRWGSWPWRVSLGPTMVPFANTRAILAAFQLPAPIGDQALIARVIQRNAPAWLYRMPINGAELLAFEGPGTARYLARESLRASGKILRRVRERLASRRSTQRRRTPQLAAAAYFAGQGFELMQSLLLAPDSLARDLFSTTELERSIAAHRQSMTELPMLGVLMTLEVWRRSLKRVKRA